MISIIIPYYRGEKTIRAALQSCAPGREIGAGLIVVFDSAEDERSVEVKSWIRSQAGSSFPQTTIIQNETNLGQVAARRKAAALVNTEYMIFLDQDDELTPARFRLEDMAGHDVIFYQTLRKSSDTETIEYHPRNVKYLNFLNIPILNQLRVARRQPARLGATTIRSEIATQHLPRNGGGGEEWEFFTGILGGPVRKRYVYAVGLVRHVHGDNQSIVHRRERLAHWLRRIETSPFNILVKRYTAYLVRKAIARQARQ